MGEQNYAPLNTQLGEAVCPLEDTEELRRLREKRDGQSWFLYGNRLAAQYRFKEAVRAYGEALCFLQNDWKVWYSLSGARLTLRRFEEAEAGYRRCVELGAEGKKVAFPLGISSYLQGEYERAAERFMECLPCGDEMKITVIYWHSLCCFRLGRKAELLGEYRVNMEVGHHTACRLAVSVFCGEISWKQGMEELTREQEALNYVTGMYGLGRYLDQAGKKEESRYCLEKLLEREEVWPCIPYLAAWGDRQEEEPMDKDRSRV